MNRKEKEDYIYKYVANKTLKLWTLVYFEWRATPTRFLWLSQWKPWVIYWTNREWNKYHRRFSHKKITKIYWNTVHIWDCLWRIDDDRLLYFINEIRYDTSSPLSSQDDECLDFIILSIKWEN